MRADDDSFLSMHGRIAVARRRVGMHEAEEAKARLGGVERETTSLVHRQGANNKSKSVCSDYSCKLLPCWEKVYVTWVGSRCCYL